ncbi:MAG: acetate CoA-transferase subunit alpha [Firmicutes bacterium]|jgi:acetate CoA/acetoacetate CoA-transferase alpha subunit|nr:acetate CoA-transferase subunit alpha [Bacillota bacterium]
MNKIISAKEAAVHIKDGMTVMLGGFLGFGTADEIVDLMCENKVKDLTVICNDTSFPDKNIGKLVVNKQVKKVIASHIGTNPETGRQMNENEIQVDLVPQGTLAERIRSGGTGLGGVLTPTGVGTIVEEGKQKIVLNGKEYLLEEALRADVAVIKGAKADKMGNIVYKRASKNFNPVMAMAADIVIAEVDEIVEVGELDPDMIDTPNIFIDYIVEGGK